MEVMALDEAIKHCEEISQDQENRANILLDSREKKYCIECAAEHRKLAEWLKDYKRLLEQEPLFDKIRAEIVGLANEDAYGDYQQGFNFGLMRAVQIIDKYKEGG